jgi:hypothetical protein
MCDWPLYSELKAIIKSLCDPDKSQAFNRTIQPDAAITADYFILILLLDNKRNPVVDEGFFPRHTIFDLVLHPSPRIAAFFFLFLNQQITRYKMVSLG